MKNKKGNKTKNKRKFFSRKGHKKYGRKKGVVLISKSIKEHYPPALRTTLTVNMPFGINQAIGVGLDNNSFYAAARANGLISTGVATGPGGTVLAAYGANYPAGINYLLGNPTPGNVVANTVTAPYSRYLVIGSRCRIRIYEDNNTAIGAISNSVTRLMLIPFEGDVQAIANGITMPMGNWVEQPYVKSSIMPFQQTAGKYILTNHISTKKLFGINKNMTTDDTNYIGTYNTNPTLPWTWLFGINNLYPANTAALYFAVEMIVDYDIIFFERNVFKSVAPS